MIHQTHGTTEQGRLSVSEMRLLLLISRPALTLAQRSLAADLLPQVQQWPAFIDTAWRKYSLLMVYQNLASLTDSAPPDDILATLRALSQRLTMEMLRRQAVFERFHAECVLPSGVDYAYFKGPALAARFYPDPTHRFYRDIDILVPHRQRIDLLRRMRDQGCRVYRNISVSPEVTDLDSDIALADFLSVTPVPHVLTPQGLLVELHDQIDHGTALFDTDAMLRDTVDVTTQKHCIRVLPDPAHIVFICYHHTRHFWNKLHWLADLDVIFNHPEFDRNAVLDHARTLKIDSTVRASLELHDLVSSAQHPSDSKGAMTPGGDMLRACIEGLAGDKEIELEMRRGWRLRALVFDWQEMPVSLLRQIWLRLRMFRPAYEDLRAVPGGQKLQGLRYIGALGVRLLRGGPRRLARAFQR